MSVLGLTEASGANSAIVEMPMSCNPVTIKIGYRYNNCRSPEPALSFVVYGYSGDVVVYTLSFPAAVTGGTNTNGVYEISVPAPQPVTSIRVVASYPDFAACSPVTDGYIELQSVEILADLCYVYSMLNAVENGNLLEFFGLPDLEVDWGELQSGVFAGVPYNYGSGWNLSLGLAIPASVFPPLVTVQISAEGYVTQGNGRNAFRVQNRQSFATLFNQNLPDGNYAVATNNLSFPAEGMRIFVRGYDQASNPGELTGTVGLQTLSVCVVDL